jgi:hypothetical protein
LSWSFTLVLADLLEQPLGRFRDRDRPLALGRLDRRDDEVTVDPGERATDSQELVLEVDVRPLQRERLTAPQASVDQQREQRGVAAGLGRLQQCPHLLGGQEHGLLRRDLGPFHDRRRVAGERTS